MIWKTHNGRSIWQEMERMRRDLDRMSDGFMLRRAPTFPRPSCSLAEFASRT